MSLDEIVAHGNRSFSPNRLAVKERIDNNIVCADGFKLSVIAGDGTYCIPRPSNLGLGHVPEGYPGPFTHVEVGYPSERPEPWHCTAWNDGYDRHEDHPVCDGWQKYAEDWEETGETWGTVYGYVPVEMVRALIALHGGERS